MEYPNGATSEAIDRLVRHAEKYGLESVFEAAEQDPSYTPLELCVLAQELRKIDKTWKLNPGSRSRLVSKLTELGVLDKAICRLLEITQPTLRKVREQDASVRPPEAHTRPPRPGRGQSAERLQAFSSEAENASGDVQ